MHTLRSSLNIFLTSCLLLAAAAGCGQRGPLYLPDKKAESPSQQEPESVEPGQSAEDGNEEDQ